MRSSAIALVAGGLACASGYTLPRSLGTSWSSPSSASMLAEADVIVAAEAEGVLLADVESFSGAMAITSDGLASGLLLSSYDVAEQILEWKEVLLAFGVLACVAVFGDVTNRKPEGMLDTWGELSQRTIAAKRDRWEEGTPIYSDAELQTVFQSLDVSGDGQIDISELEGALRQYVSADTSEKTIMKMLSEADVDGDRQVSFDEFKRIMRGGQASVL